MHHQSKLMKKIKKRKEIHYLLHACSSCQMALLGAGPLFEFWSILDSFFEVFWAETRM